MKPRVPAPFAARPSNRARQGSQRHHHVGAAAVVLALVLCVPSTLILPTHAQSPAPTAGDPAGDVVVGWPTADGWSQYGGSARHAGASPSAGPATFKAAMTAADLGGRSFTAPVADLAGNLYVGTDDGRVLSFTPSLQKRWEARVDGPMRASVLVTADGTVYAAPVSENLFLLDAATGKKRSTVPSPNLIEEGQYVVTASPTLHPSGRIIVAALSGQIFAYDPATQTKAWEFTVDEPFTGEGNRYNPSTPAVGPDGTIYVGSQNNRLYAFAPDGNLKWTYATRTHASQAVIQEEQIVAAPSVGPDGTVYVTTRLKRELVGGIYALEDDGNGATLRWVTQLDDKVTAPATISPSGHVFVGATDGSFYRLDPEDGSIVWTFHPRDDDPDVYPETQAKTTVTNIQSVAELAVIDATDTLFVPYWHVDLSTGEFPPQDSFASPLYALDANDGSILWRQVFPKALRSPLLIPANTPTATATDPRPALLYVVSDAGRLHAIGNAPVRTSDAAPAQPDPENENATEPDTLPPETPQDPGSNATNATRSNQTDPSEDTPGPGAFLTALLVGLLATRGSRRRPPTQRLRGP